MKTYLGDSVYVELEDRDIKLYTDNGYGPVSLIYLEEPVFRALQAWAKEYFRPQA